MDLLLTLVLAVAAPDPAAPGSVANVPSTPEPTSMELASPAAPTISVALSDALAIDAGSSTTGEYTLDRGVPWADLPSLNGSSRALSLQDDTPEAAVAFGAKGSTRWTVKGLFGVQVTDSRNTEASLGLGIQWFIVEDFAFAPEINFWGFFQEGEDAVGGSLDLLFQWHVLKGEGWTVYGDFGCGILGTNKNVPINGSQFNFTPQAGLGATFDVGSDRRWIVGVRWHHISNASLYADNPGRDSIVIYTGLNLPF